MKKDIVVMDRGSTSLIELKRNEKVSSTFRTKFLWKLHSTSDKVNMKIGNNNISVLGREEPTYIAKHYVAPVIMNENRKTASKNDDLKSSIFITIHYIMKRGHRATIMSTI